MQIDRLFIYKDDVEYELALAPDALIALNMQINDLGELQDRQANFSQQFKVVKNNENTYKLEMAGLITSATNLPYRKIKCRVNKLGIDVIPNGIAIHESTDQFYNMTVYSGNFFLADLLKDKLLSELDFSAYNHVFDLATVYGSRNNVYTDGYIYGIVDFSDDDAFMNNHSGVMDIRRNIPQLFFKTIFNKILAGVGITISGDFFSSSFFENLLLQMGTDKYGFMGKILRAASTADYGNFRFDDDNSGDPFAQTGNFDINDHWGNSAGSNLSPKTAFRFREDLKCSSEIKIKFHVNYSFTGGVPNGANFLLKLFKSDIAFSTPIILWQQTIVINDGSTQTGTIVVDCPDFNFSKDDTLIMGLIVTDHAGNSFGPIAYITTGSYVEAEIFKLIPCGYGSPIYINQLMPELKQYDFVKAIMQMAALFVDTDSFSNKVSFTMLQEIIDNIPNAEDWSAKLHDSKDKDPIQYRIGNYAKRNWLRYKEDPNVTPEYGDGYFDVDDETLEKEQTILTLPFAASENRSRLYTGVIQHYVPLIKRWAGDGTPSITTEPRVLLLNRKDAVALDYKRYQDGTGANLITDFNPWCIFIDPNELHNLGFQNSLIADNYAGLIAILTHCKKIAPLFNLTGDDIRKLDYSLPVFISKFNNYFYKNKVVNYNGKGLTKVELIRL